MFRIWVLQRFDLNWSLKSHPRIKVTQQEEIQAPGFHSKMSVRQGIGTSPPALIHEILWIKTVKSYLGAYYATQRTGGWLYSINIQLL